MFRSVLRTEMWLTGFDFFFYRYILMSTFWSHLHTNIKNDSDRDISLGRYYLQSINK
jgi:hypothetical protein